MNLLAAASTYTFDLWDWIRSLFLFEGFESRLEFADKMVLVGYFVLMLGIGVYFYRYMRGIKDYFSGGNNIPWWLSGVSFYMSSFSVFAFVSYSALAFKYGWVSVTLLWVTVPATVFSVTLFAKRWRRARIDSPVEYLETRYSAGFRQLIAWQGIPVKMVDDGLKLVAIGTFISVSLGLPTHVCMFWSGIIILLYTFMGGLWAVAVTDFIQFVVMAIAVLILLPLSINRIGGIENLDKIVPAGIGDFFTAEYNWVYVILLSLLYCVAWSSINWPLIQRYYCVADEKEALKVGWFVTLLNVIGPPLMFIPAMAAVHFLGDVPGKEVYPRLCVELLPPGILGLVVAAMFAATMSMLSSDYNVCAGVLTTDVYRRLIHHNASQKELVAVGRLLTLVIGVFALGVAFLMSAGTGEDLFKNMVTLFSIVTAPVGVPMILGLLSRRVTNLAALVGWFIGILVGLALLQWCPGTINIVISDGDGSVIASQLLEKEIVLFSGTLIVSLFVTLAVSLLAPMKLLECKRADDFIDRLQTPIGTLEEDLATAGGSSFSPFGVVGFSVLAIGLMLLAVIPWVGPAWEIWLEKGPGLAVWLTIGFGILMLLIGSVMLVFGRNTKRS